MSAQGQERTHAVYEDPVIVAGYIEKHAKEPKLTSLVETFAATIPGSDVLNLGCGPGQDAYRLAELGFQVTGLDYSAEMIRAAQRLRSSDNPPHFLVGDMRDLPTLFSPDTFDAIWASASLLHISEQAIPAVLEGIHSITRNGGKVYIGVKAGPQGEQMVAEAKYGKPMEREFTFWEKDAFTMELAKHGFQLDEVREQFQGPTLWLNFFSTVAK